MKRSIRKVIAFCCVATAMMVTAIPAQAATKKPKLEVSKASISLGTKGYHKMGDNWDTVGTHQIAIKNTKKGAKYVCTTSNKKVVTVKVKSNKINLTGLKAGTATITCKQTINGKTTTVGKVTVTVKNAKIRNVSEKTPIDQYTYNDMIDYCEESPYIEYYSADNKVKYKISVDKKGFTVSDSKQYVGGSRVLNYDATKAGIYTVTLKQTYNKKTVTSSAKVNCIDAEVEKEVTFFTGQSYDWLRLVYYTSSKFYYQFEGVDVDLFTKTDDSILYIDEDYKLHPLKAGIVNVNVYYYDKKMETRGKLLGTCKITVEEYHTEQISFDEYFTQTYVNEYTMENPGYLSVDVNPSYSMDPVEIVSSDDSVLKIFSETDEYGYVNWYYVPVGAGTVTITATSNGVTESKTIVVYETEDEYWENLK